LKYIIFILLLLSRLCADASYNRGETIFFAKACTSCHGAAAEGSTTYPRLANKKEIYLLKRLHYFKTGNVLSVSQQMMAQFIQKLNEQNMRDLAHFLANHQKLEIDDVSDDILGGFGS